MDRVDYAIQFMGTPYKWGGNSPLVGLDCSGFACEALRAEGLIKWNEDLNSQMLYERFKQPNMFTKIPDRGDLIFYGKDINTITHVAIALNRTQMIEAGGGNSTTVNHEEAAKRNAMVRVRPIDYRRDFLAAVKI